MSFKINPSRMKEWLDDYYQKLAALKQDNEAYQDWNDGELIGGDLSMHASYEEDDRIPFSMRGLKYVQLTKGSMMVPMIVIENDSLLEIRDSLIRANRMENNPNGGD